jgi:hypothetical protein
MTVCRVLLVDPIQLPVVRVRIYAQNGATERLTDVAFSLAVIIEIDYTLDVSGVHSIINDSCICCK